MQAFYRYLKTPKETHQIHRQMEWDVEEQQAFEMLRNTISDKTLLAQPRFNLPFAIQCDASNIGLDAVLCQNQGVVVPISFASRCPSDRETKYHAQEKECLAVKWALEKFAPFVDGHEDLTVITDHESLVWLMKQDLPSSGLARWILQLQAATPFKIVHRPGTANVNVDAP